MICDVVLKACTSYQIAPWTSMPSVMQAGQVVHLRDDPTQASVASQVVIVSLGAPRSTFKSQGRVSKQSIVQWPPLQQSSLGYPCSIKTLLFFSLEHPYCTVITLVLYISLQTQFYMLELNTSNLIITTFMNEWLSAHWKLDLSNQAINQPTSLQNLF